MDRVTVYYGQLPRETDILNSQQNAMVALAKLAEAVLGTSTMVDGFTLTPTAPASLNVLLTRGSIFQVENLEASVWSSLPADIAHSILKQGILLDPVTLGITPPITVGFSQVYLIEVQYADLDTGATVLPYYNASTPAVSFNGPGNSGSAQNTIRKGIVATQIKAGIAATTGTQAAPTPDAGWTGLFTVTVANGQTTVTSGNIAQLASAPFIPVKLPQVPAGVQNGQWLYGVDTGAVNSVAAVLSPAPVSLTPGMTVRVKVAITNTGAMTFNPNALGASAIVKSNGAAMSAGDVTANMTLELSWTGSNWQAVNYIGVQSSTSTVNNNYTLTIPFVVDSSVAANSIIATFSPAITSLAAGDMLKVKLANSFTGPATITINALAAIALSRPNGSAIAQGDGVAGQILILEYDGTKLQVVSASTSAAGTVGESRSLVGNAAGTTQTASWSWDELVVSGALGGASFKSFSQSLTLNCAATGAGGMDTGTLPVSGDLYVYAIYNPTTQTSALLGTTAGAGSAVYSGAHMPSGYLASALISALKTTANPYVKAFNQLDRDIEVITTKVLSTGTATSVTAISLAGVVPPCAKSVSGGLFLDTSTTIEQTASVQPNSTNAVGEVYAEQQVGAGSGVEVTTTFSRMILLTAQTIYYYLTPNGDTGSNVDVAISGYSI